MDTYQTTTNHGIRCVAPVDRHDLNRNEAEAYLQFLLSLNGLPRFIFRFFLSRSIAFIYTTINLCFGILSRHKGTSYAGTK